jgi:hypothetical protein
MPDFPFRTIRNFDAIADHLSRYCGISRELASKRLHALKTFRGLSGSVNVVFDMTGGVYLNVEGELEPVGSLTAGGAKETA